MTLHYKKDGTLDMRYSSSRAAVSSASSYGSYGGSSYAPSSYAAPSYHYYHSSSSSRSNGSTRSRDAGLHYKKDGTLDMRYSSSRAALASAPAYTRQQPQQQQPYTRATPAPAPVLAVPSSQLHYKKDGTLDMRYNSSRAAVAAASGSRQISSASASTSARHSYTPSQQQQQQELHYKKDGTLDMRYKSSIEAIAQQMRGLDVSATRPAHTTTRSSSTASRRNGTEGSRQALDIPAYVPVTKRGRPDLRTRVAKDWVRAQAQAWTDTMPLPPWLPRLKDGAPDSSQAITRSFFRDAQPPPAPCREAYYAARLLESVFERLVALRRAQDVPCVQMPERLRETPTLRAAFDTLYATESSAPASSVHPVASASHGHSAAAATTVAASTIRDDTVATLTTPTPAAMGSTYVTATTVAANSRRSSSGSTQRQDAGAATSSSSSGPLDVRALSHVAQLDYARDLVIAPDAAPLGRGSFGIVLRGTWRGTPVAIKQLHAAQLSRRDRQMFTTETRVLGALGAHPNIVQLVGYTLAPVAIVMELVARGSLSYLLHYCDDAEVEAAMTDGRVKRNLLLGVAFGMAQLHACGVTHGDLKPQNVLVSTDYHAKIADFGLATIRARTSALTSSHVLQRGGSVGDNGRSSAVASGVGRGASGDNSSSGHDDGDEEDSGGGVCGTAAYMAPELLNPRVVANEKTDVYSFGVLMNELLMEEEPYYERLREFVGKGPFAAALAAQSGQRPLLRDARVPPALKALVELCWHAEPATRPSFEAIAAFLLANADIPDSC